MEKETISPVLITDTTGDLNQAFIVGLNEALKREGLQNLVNNLTLDIKHLSAVDCFRVLYWQLFLEKIHS